MKMSNSFWLNDSTARVAPMMWMAATGTSPYPEWNVSGDERRYDCHSQRERVCCKRVYVSLNPPVQVKLYAQSSPEHNLIRSRDHGITPPVKADEGGAMPMRSC